MFNHLSNYSNDNLNKKACQGLCICNLVLVGPACRQAGWRDFPPKAGPFLVENLTKKSGWRDLNPRPQRPERCALASCATARLHPLHQITVYQLFFIKSTPSIYEIERGRRSVEQRPREEKN